MDKTYTPPMITDYGTVQAITAGLADGDFTDKTFPVTTPKKDLTFS